MTEFDWPDIDGAEYHESDQVIASRIDELAEETGRDPERIYETVIDMIDTTGSGELVNEGTGGGTLTENPDSEGDTRLEALNIWALRQRI